MSSPHCLFDIPFDSIVKHFHGLHTATKSGHDKGKLSPHPYALQLRNDHANSHASSGGLPPSLRPR